MLSDYFVDEVLKACVGIDPKHKYAHDIFGMAHDVFEWYTNETEYDSVPVLFRSKILMTSHFIDKRMSMEPSDTISGIIDTLRYGRYKHDLGIFDTYTQLTDSDVDRIYNMLIKKKLLSLCMIDKKNVLEKLIQIDTGSYDDDDVMIGDWADIIERCHKRIVDVKQTESKKEAAFIDLYADSYDCVMDRLRAQTTQDRVVPTGYAFLKDALPSDGFEPSRLYMFGGTSGVGKSTSLVNLALNAVVGSPYKPKKDVYVYITAENLIDESVLRIYCTLTGNSIDDTIERYTKDPSFTLQTEIREIFETKGATLQVIYMRPGKTTVSDLDALLNSITSKGQSIRGLYIDYLDLFKTSRPYGSVEKRHELGEITMGFKNLAVMHQIPVITASQLNKGGYDSKSDASLTSISESMQKIDNSDFVAFLQNDAEATISIPSDSGIPINCKHIKLTILKNRNGSSNCSTNLIMRETAGVKKVFNYKLEEKPQFAQTIDDSVADTSSGSGMSWNDF